MHCNEANITLESLQQEAIVDTGTQDYYRRGTELVCVGRYAEAIEWFDRALERDPRSREVLVALAVAEDRLGLYREAVLSS